MDSIIRLFKAVPVSSKRRKKINDSLLKQTIKKGFLFAPEVVHNYSEKELVELIKKIEKEVGLSGEQMNSSFHKSWTKVKDSSMFQLVVEQLFHYLTTYGYEALGIYDKDSVYIPNEKLEIPELEDGITLTIIKGYTKKEIKQKLLNLLNQGIALGEDTIKDVVDVSLFVDINEQEIEQIRNKETKTILYDYLGKFPESPVEFLRYVIYKSTKTTLLIKNKVTIEKIKSEQNIDVLRLFREYRDKHGLEKLAQIFFRFKPLFLAFKTNSGLKPIINKIRKLADVNHVPMKQDYLNNVTAMIKKGTPIIDSQLTKELDRVNTFRKIRLVYALNFRTKDVDSILYKIRNGKGYAKAFTFPDKKVAKVKGILSTVLESIIQDMRKNVEGKRIYIPESVVYALPATEKQFTGDFPSGSYITIPRDMVVGVHWNNVNNHRIDLDLSLVNTESGKISWDARYRNEERSILFSGDVTDSSGPNGASELFFVKKQYEKASFIMFVNYYNYNKDVTVPFKILVAKEHPSDFEENYMVNPNNVVSVAKTKIDKEQKILGLLVTSVDECRFYFSEINIGRSISSSGNKYTEQSKKYLFDFYTNTISLNGVLKLAGAEIITEKDNVDIDLSPESLEKDKIIKLCSSFQ